MHYGFANYIIFVRFCSRANLDRLKTLQEAEIFQQPATYVEKYTSASVYYSFSIGSSI